MAATLATICRIKGWSKARIEKWISDGHFVPLDEPEPGKSRHWAAQDLTRLLCFMRLMDAGVKVEVGRAIGRLHGFHSGSAYLVIEAFDRDLVRGRVPAPEMHPLWDQWFKEQGDAPRHRAWICQAGDVLSHLEASFGTIGIFVMALDKIEAEARNLIERAERMERGSKG